MKNVSVKIDGVMLLVLIALAGGVWVYFKGGAVKEVATVGLNPTNQNNYINQAAQGVFGEDNLQGYADHWYGVLFNYTPWALFSSDTSKEYGKNVWAETLGLKE